MMSVLGMGAFLSAVARTPITAAVMVFEMTGSYNFILPIMLCSAIADLTAEKLGHKPIYSMLIVNDSTKNGSAKILSDIKVKAAMTQNVQCVFINDKICDIKEKFNKEPYTIYPVINNKKKLCGYITKAGIEDLLLQGVNEITEAGKIMNPTPITIQENENLYIAYYRLHSNNTKCLFITDKFSILKGIITRKDIINKINTDKKTQMIFQNY